MPGKDFGGLENHCASLRYRGFESPSAYLQGVFAHDPVQEAGFSRLWGDFGGNSGANSPAANRLRRTCGHLATRRSVARISGATWQS